jgi:hypothetical protein
MINIIVAIVTLIAAGFLLLWILRPSFRTWVERPKYAMLESDQRFRDAKKQNERPNSALQNPRRGVRE